MLLTVVRVYERGRRLSEAELRAATRCRRDVRTQTVTQQCEWRRSIRK